MYRYGKLIAQLFAGVGVGVALRRCSSHNRHAWLQSQGILRQFAGQLLAVVVAKFATTTADGELEQESNLHILQKCSSAT